MKKKKTNFESRFWSGSKKYSVPGLLETFFQFNDLAIVKEVLGSMMHCSTRRKARIRTYPAEIFHLQQSLRSLLLAGRLIAAKAGKWTVPVSAEAVSSMQLSSLSEEEYQDPLRVFRKAFKTCSFEEFDEFLASTVYFSLGNISDDREKRRVSPYIHLIKMLDAAYLITERKMQKQK